jgi:hypothetical protein
LRRDFAERCNLYPLLFKLNGGQGSALNAAYKKKVVAISLFFLDAHDIF